MRSYRCFQLFSLDRSLGSYVKESLFCHVLCSVYERDSEEAMKLCGALLTDPDCNRAVRYGDVYAMMTEHYARLQQWKAVSICSSSSCCCCCQLLFVVVVLAAAAAEIVLLVVALLW